MGWAAVDRAIRLFGPRREWLAARDDMLATLRSEGARDGAFRQALGSDASDATSLLLGAIGLPVDLAATIEFVQDELRRGDLVRRYRADDGLAGSEGSFAACSFWLAEALVAAGRHDAGRDLFERLLARANDVGLYAEEFDLPSGAFLGNFPQALTHLALVGCASSLALAERKGVAALRGSPAERAVRSVGATIGWRGLLAGLRSGAPFRLRPSAASRLARGRRPAVA
jgi:GH15 family glucan-1,4-alpha-glucosidase